jgi:prepilin-type N-terminal cleavage/methylation domain-containing protein
MQYFLTHQRKTRGFSLTEMLVVIALFTIIMLAIFDSIASFYRLNAYTLAQSYQVDNARRGTEFMVRDLREMTFSDNGTFPLVSMGSTTVGFYSDIDRDNSVEYVTYTLASTTLTKRIYNATGNPPVYSTTTPESTHIISEYVQNALQGIPIFVYYNNDGDIVSATSTVTDIRYVQVSVIVNIDPIRDPGQYMLRSSASLRNLKN